MPPLMSRCAYLPENFPAYDAGSGCGAPLASPSSVMVGTVITGSDASRFGDARRRTRSETAGGASRDETRPEGAREGRSRAARRSVDGS